MSDELTQALQSLFVVALVAALAPLIVGIMPRLRVPQVVVLIVSGVIVGPQVLDLAEPASIELLSHVGLGFLFLLAGYELELALFRQRAGKLAVIAWVASAVLAGALVGLLASVGLVRAFVPVALGLTTTALGTLLPILRDNNMLRGAFGSFVLAGGAVGEFFPIVAIAVFLSSNGRFFGLLSLVAVAVIALVLSLIPRLVRGGRVQQLLAEQQGATAQTTLRWTVAMLCCFSLLLTRSASMLSWVRSSPALCSAVGHPETSNHWKTSWMPSVTASSSPVFFVASGMGLDLRSIVHSPGRLVLFFGLLLVVRGLPTLLIYRSALPRPQRLELVFLMATALPLLVALSEIGLETGEMLPENAAALVGAGVLSVLVFPGIAVAIDRRIAASRSAQTS